MSDPTERDAAPAGGRESKRDPSTHPAAGNAEHPPEVAAGGGQSPGHVGGRPAQPPLIASEPAAVSGPAVDQGAPAAAAEAPAPGGYLASARLIAVLTLGSRILGLLRDMAMAHLFGTTRVSDAFVLAFTAPNLFRRLFGEGALSAAFVPLFARTLAEEGRARAARVFSVTATWTALLLSGLAILGAAGCLGWRAWAEPGADNALALLLTAILLPYLVFICLVALFSGALNTLRHFLAPALAPILFNVTWLGALYFVVDRSPDASRSHAAVVLAGCLVVGGALQLLLQLPSLAKREMLPRFAPDRRDPALPALAAVMGPMMFGAAVFQLNVLADRVIAWWLIEGEGALSVLYYGNRLMQFPLGIIGVAMGTAVFPLLARLAANKEDIAAGGARFRAVFVEATGVTLLLAVPASVGLFVIRAPLISLFFERAAFNAGDGARTAAVLAVYAVSIWAACLTGVATRALYSLGQVRVPVRIGAQMVVLNLGLNLALVGPFAELGLASATVTAHLVNVVLLLRALSHALPGEAGLPWRKMGREGGVIALLSALMGLVAWVCLWSIPTWHPGWRLALPTASGIAVYGLLAWLALPQRLRSVLRR